MNPRGADAQKPDWRAVAGVNRHDLKYWRLRGYLPGADWPAPGIGHRLAFTARQLVILRLMNRLRCAGIKPQFHKPLIESGLTGAVRAWRSAGHSGAETMTGHRIKIADRFDVVRTQASAGGFHHAVRLVCGGCGAVHEIPMNTRKALPPDVIARKAQQAGWLVGKKREADRCPDCLNGGRKTVTEPNPPAAPAAAPMAEPPREPSRTDKRIIMNKLEDVYLDEKTGYAAGHTDAAVAKDLGVPRAWVSAIREEFFGPAVNERVHELKGEVDGLKDEMRALVAMANAVNQKLAEASDRMGRIERELAKAMG